MLRLARSQREPEREDEDGTRTLDWASEHPRPPLREATSVRASLRSEAEFWNWNLDRNAACGRKKADSKFAHQARNGTVKLRIQTENNKLTLRVHRQEVPFHRSRLYPWPYLDRHRRFHQDAPYPHYPPRIPPLHPQVLQIREETQELGCARFPCFPC